MDLSSITMQQIVYWPVDIPSPASKSRIECLMNLRFLAYKSKLKNWVLGSRVGIDTYLGGTPLIWEHSAPALSPGGTGGLLGRALSRYWLMCTQSIAPPVWLRILYCASLARKVAIHSIFTNQRQVSLYRSHHLSMPWKPNRLHNLFWDIGMRFLDQVLCFLYCSTQKISCSHFGDNQGKVHVGLF